MKKPDYFPNQEWAAVFIAIRRATENLKAAHRVALRDRASTNVDALARQFVLTIFAEFAHQACQLGLRDEKSWPVSRIQDRCPEFLAYLAHAAPRECSELGVSISEMTQDHSMGYSIRTDVMRMFKASDEWREYEAELETVAEAQSPSGKKQRLDQAVEMLAHTMERISDTTKSTSASEPATNIEAFTSDSPTTRIGERLDQIVFAEGISHEELAHRIGISRANYFRVKAGKGSRFAIGTVKRFLAECTPPSQSE
jgi:DNA-binding Xre family transcriptional regulator